VTATLPVTGAELAAAVSPEDQARLLQLPRSRPFEGEIRTRVAAARSWYAENGRPFLAWRRQPLDAVEPGVIRLRCGQELRSAALSRRLASAGAHGFVALCASAGPEVAEEADRHWREERPDEAFFLDRFGAAVAEGLVRLGAAALSRAGEAEGETLLPHLSPGCGDWDLSDQHRLWAILFADGSCPSGPLRILESGGLSPRHSVLAGLGVARLRAEAE
jgi:hypothetical protein